MGDGQNSEQRLRSARETRESESDCGNLSGSPWFIYNEMGMSKVPAWLGCVEINKIHHCIQS